MADSLALRRFLLIGLLSHWSAAGTSRIAWENANFNGDNAVNDGDLSMLLSHWSGDNNAAVPEPGTLAMLAIGAMAIIRRRA